MDNKSNIEYIYLLAPFLLLLLYMGLMSVSPSNFQFQFNNIYLNVAEAELNDLGKAQKDHAFLWRV